MTNLCFRNILTCILVTMLFHFSFINILFAQETKIMTFNIKYDDKSDTVNNWQFRKEGLIDLIKHYQPDILGIQEGLNRQVEYMDSCLTKYDYIGVGRDDGKTKGEYSAIFYKKDLFSIIVNSTFWLSETPEKISIGWDAALERICTFGLFKINNSEKMFWVFNTHFDHIGETARARSAKLIIDKIESLNAKKYPVVLMGDFNTIPSSKPIKTILEKLNDAAELSISPLYGPVGTFNGFTNRIMKNRIDYIFTKDFRIINYTHIDDKLKNNKHISDHLPVISTLVFN